MENIPNAPFKIEEISEKRLECNDFYLINRKIGNHFLISIEWPWQEKIIRIPDYSI